MTDPHLRSNRDLWDALTTVHEQSAYYDVAGFLAGRSRLHPLEREALGDVAGRSLLHLQCHFGLDTLSWARLGAHVTGVDFSPAAIALARRLAAETGLPATFVESDVLALPEALSGQFDIVYTSYGVLIWLPDLAAWGRTVAHFLRPGGTFFIAEFHPFSLIFGEDPPLQIGEPYFTSGEPVAWEVQGSYADRSAEVAHDVSYEWPHPLSEIFAALLGAGLRIEAFDEYDYAYDALLPGMVQGEDGAYRLAEHGRSVPLMFSLRATKPLDPGSDG